MSKSFKEEHPLGKVIEGDDDEPFALYRDVKATDVCSRKKVSFSFRSDLDAARQFFEGIVTDDFVYFVAYLVINHAVTGARDSFWLERDHPDS
jgi:hypothetical protein